MQYLIMFFTITIISIVIALRLKIRTEQAIPITVIGMIIIVYLTGIIGNLEIGIILIYIIFPKYLNNHLMLVLIFHL